MSNESGPGPPPDEREPFDQAALGELRAAAQRVIAAHPEVRSVVVVLDYNGVLNDAPGLNKALWLGENEGVNTLPAVLGSLQNTLGALEQMFVRAQQINDQLRGEAVVLGREITKRRSELEQLKGQPVDTVIDPITRSDRTATG